MLFRSVGNLVAALYQEIRDDFSKELQKDHQEAKEITEEQVSEKANQVVQKWLNIFLNHETIGGFDPNLIQEVREKYREPIDELQRNFSSRCRSTRTP